MLKTLRIYNTELVPLFQHKLEKHQHDLEY